MDFRRFLHAIVLLPAISAHRRRVIYRLLSYNRWLKDLFAGLGASALAPCHLAKPNTSNTHYGLC